MPTTIRATAALAVVLALLTATTGCSASTANLDGRAFLAVAVTDGGAVKALVPGTRISLNFGATVLNVSAGCNSIAGDYGIDGGRLVFERIEMTDMGCDQQRDAQDQWLVTFLASKPSLLFVGNDLTIEGGSTVIRFLDRKVAEPDLTLVGPTWTVESIIDRDAVSSAPQGATATLSFKANGTLDVNAGCNRGSGTWRLDGAGIAFFTLMLTKMACQGPGAALESAVVEVLGARGLAARIDVNELTLSNGTVGLQLRGS